MEKTYFGLIIPQPQKKLSILGPVKKNSTHMMTIVVNPEKCVDITPRLYGQIPPTWAVQYIPVPIKQNYGCATITPPGIGLEKGHIRFLGTNFGIEGT